jgi:hypothetical protein
MAHSEVRACCVAEDGEDRTTAPLSREGLRDRAVFVLSGMRQCQRPFRTPARFPPVNMDELALHFHQRAA